MRPSVYAASASPASDASSSASAASNSTDLSPVHSSRALQPNEPDVAHAHPVDEAERLGGVTGRSERAIRPLDHRGEQVRVRRLVPDWLLEYELHQIAERERVAAAAASFSSPTASESE